MELIANTRLVTGKKVKFLRRQGLTPVHVFGHGIEPMAVQCETGDLRKVIAQAGTTGIVSPKLDKDQTARNVMIREIQKDAISGEYLHVDLYQIRMEEKLKVDVPLVIVGEAPALKDKENYMAQEVDTFSVECMPDHIPQHIEIDISGLEEVDQAIHVQDVVVGEGITVLNPADQLIVKITVRHAGKGDEEQPAVETPGETPGA